MSRLIQSLSQFLIKPRSMKSGVATSVSSNKPSGSFNWQARWVNINLGWPGMLAGGMIVAYGVFYATVILPTQALITSTQDKIHVVEEKRAHGDLKKEFLQTPEGRLSTFYQFLPADKNATDWVEKIFAGSESVSINLDKGDYLTVRSKNGKLVRYQITLPVTASYPQIRSYINNLLDEIPFMALENVEYHKQKIGDADVEATIKFVLYFVGEGA